MLFYIAHWILLQVFLSSQSFLQENTQVMLHLSCHLMPHIWVPAHILSRLKVNKSNSTGCCYQYIIIDLKKERSSVCTWRGWHRKPGFQGFLLSELPTEGAQLGPLRRATVCFRVFQKIRMFLNKLAEISMCVRDVWSTKFGWIFGKKKTPNRKWRQNYR